MSLANKVIETPEFLLTKHAGGWGAVQGEWGTPSIAKAKCDSAHSYSSMGNKQSENLPQENWRYLQIRKI